VVVLQIEGGVQQILPKATMIVNHKPIFVMAKRDPILDTIEKIMHQRSTLMMISIVATLTLGLQLR
jgi:hypothetical protein